MTQAGIISDVNSRSLVIALEPEAASLHCRRLDVHGFVGEDEYREANFKTGTKYLVIDAGGESLSRNNTVLQLPRRAPERPLCESFRVCADVIQMNH